MTRFDDDTALTQVGNGQYMGEAPEGWRVGRGVNGGYLAAVTLRAMLLALDDPTRHPRSLTLHYLEPLDAGPYTARVVVERAGRSFATVSARLLQNGYTCVLAAGAFATPRRSVELSELRMPNVTPPPDATRGERFAEAPAFAGNYDNHWALGDMPFSGSEHARAGGWMRLAEPRVADAIAVAAFTDAWVPSIFPRLTGPAGVPTIDLTIHFRADLPLPNARPDDYYLGVFSSRLARNGFFEEDGEIWSRNGVLLAQSRQLALMPPERD